MRGKCFIHTNVYEVKIDDDEILVFHLQGTLCEVLHPLEIDFPFP